MISKSLNMEQNEHVLETDFGDEQSRRGDSSGQPTCLNATSFRNENKMVDKSKGIQEFKSDDVFSGEERQKSTSISVNSDDVKNCLAIIADTYSSSDDEAIPENSKQPVNNEIGLAEDDNCKVMSINNFENVSVNPITVSEKGASLEEQNNNLNGINLADAATQNTMIVEPEHLKEPETDGRTLIEPERDGQTLRDTRNDGLTLIQPNRDGCTLMELESDGHILKEPKLDRHTLMETDSDGHIVMDTKSDGPIPKEPSKDCTLIEPQNNGHIILEPGIGHTLIESGSAQSIPIEVMSDRQTLMETNCNGHTLVKTDSHGNIPIKSGSDGHMHKEPASDQSSTLEAKSDRPMLMEADCVGHTPTNNERQVLIKNENGEHTLLNTESNENILTGSESNEYRPPVKPESEMCTLMEPKSEECSLIGLERHGDTPSCFDKGHEVYAMSSIDKELESIGEVGGTSQTGGLTECTTEDNSSSSDCSSDDESSSSESESSESSSDEDLEDIRKEIEREEEHVHTGPLKTKSELSVKDLPEIPDVDITIDENIQLVELGFVLSIVESLVVVKALPQTPALDSESVLFLENRSCLGLVFETFGPVQTPFYSVRFNNNTNITDKNVHKGDKVFYAPDMMEYSNFVFVAQLKKLKGSDASWEHDEEPPQEAMEYSDDEEEAKARANKKKERMARKGSSAGDDETSKTEPSGTSDHQGPNRGGRKRTWRSRGRGQSANQNQNKGTTSTNPSPLQNPAFRGPSPQPGAALPPQAPAHMVHRPVFPPQSPFISHPTQQGPPFEMRYMGPPRGIPPSGPLGMMPQAMRPFPGPHPGAMGNVPMPPSFAPSRPMIGAQHMQGHWPVGPPSGFAPRYSMPGTQGFQNPGFQSRDLHFGMPPPPPPPPPPNF